MVGTLAEMDPIDDRLAEKMEGGGSRLLGYNTNAGMSIHMRLRTMDLSGFEPYSMLIDTLLHELAHNEVGPHNDSFWHLFGQLKSDYLHHHAHLSASGSMFGGVSPLALAGVADQVRDVRSAVLLSIARDRMAPLPPPQQVLLEAYFSLTASGGGKSVGRGASGGGAATEVGAGEVGEAGEAVAAPAANAAAAAERRAQKQPAQPPADASER